MDCKDYEIAMGRARDVNRRWEKTELEYGFLPLSRSPIFARIDTAIAAIESGLLTDDLSSIFEAQVILQELSKDIKSAIRDRN